MMCDLKDDAWLLAYTMSNISERGWAAGWMQNLEYALWHAVVSGSCYYGRTLIADDDIRVLKLLSARVGGWIYFDDEQGEVLLPLAEWQQHYEQAIQNCPGIVE
jgi:hypothetical protein